MKPTLGSIILFFLGPHASEDYQVANYGIGGQYSTHTDPHGLYEENKKDYTLNGDRFATFMTYISDVPAGGNTGIYYSISRIGRFLILDLIVCFLSNSLSITWCNYSSRKRICSILD